MGFAAHYGARAYATVGVETGVTGADPLKLILMLFEGAEVAIANAKREMAAGHIPEKGAAVSKAIAIIDDGLKASLDLAAGGEIAQHLQALYTYMTERLIRANLHNDASLLDEVAKLLSELHASWNEIASRPRQTAGAGTVAQGAAAR